MKEKRKKSAALSFAAAIMLSLFLAACEGGAAGAAPAEAEKEQSAAAVESQDKNAADQNTAADQGQNTAADQSVVTEQGAAAAAESGAQPEAAVMADRAAQGGSETQGQSAAQPETSLKAAETAQAGLEAQAQPSGETDTAGQVQPSGKTGAATAQAQPAGGTGTASQAQPASGTGTAPQAQTSVETAAAAKNQPAGGTSPSAQAESAKQSSPAQQVSPTQETSPAQQAAPAPVQAVRITASPKNADIKAGQTAVFRVSAKGTGLKYQWEKMKPSEETWKKSSAEGSRTAVLEVTEAKADWHGMKYRCKVTDAAGNTVYSKTAKLYVLSVTRDPSDQYLKVTETAVLKASAKGAGVTYQWQRRKPDEEEWQTIGRKSADNKTLTLENAKTAWNGYRFRCRCTSAAGKVVYTKAARIHVLAVRKSPTAQFIREGETAVFKTAATGGGLHFQWQVRESADHEWRNSSSAGNTTRTLKVYGRPDYNRFQFRCRVRDEKGNTSYSKLASLYVLAITKQPSNRTVSPGQTASFSIQATGGGLKFQWQVRPSSNHDWRNSSSTGHASRNLKVKVQSAYNGYRFRCKVTDKKGHTAYSKSAVLYVPAITKNPSTRKIKAGQTASFTVGARGTGLKYQWQVKEPSGGWRNSSSSGNRSKTLKVYGRTAYNGYRFRCKVTAGGKAFYSKVAALYVLGITQSPSDQLVLSGRTAIFRVRAVGSGLKYQWQVKEPSGGWRNSTSSGNKSSILNVSANHARDAFQFRCRVKDSGGNTVYSQPAYLWVQ